jgi:hypothetical protein
MRSNPAAVNVLIVFTVLCFGPLSFSNVAAQSSSSPVPTTTTRSNPGMSESGWSHELIQRKLNQPCDMDFDERPWNEVEEEIETTLGCNIILHSSAINDSLSEDEPITCNLTGINYRNGLRLILSKKNATFSVRKGVIIIISKDDMEDPKFMTNFTFSVTPLLASISKKETNRIGKPRATKHHAVTQIDKGSIDPAIEVGEKKESAEESTATQPSVELNTAESLLIDLVQSTFRPQRWKASRQGEATFNIIGGQAVAFCDDELADELRDFLKDLEFQLSHN